MCTYDVPILRSRLEKPKRWWSGAAGFGTTSGWTTTRSTSAQGIRRHHSAQVIRSINQAVSYVAPALVVDYIAWYAASARTSTSSSISGVTHCENFDTYHCSRRQNGDHWAIPLVILGQFLQVAGHRVQTYVYTRWAWRICPFYVFHGVPGLESITLHSLSALASWS